MNIKSAMQNLLLVFAAALVALAVAEGFLRLFNPVEIRVRGDKLELPRNRRYVVNNDKTDKLDSVIVVTKNQLGLRGPMPPADYANYLSLITIGGSTTECFYLSDGQTWTDALERNLINDYGVDSLWVNNAGLDGNTTFGHYVLMEDYIIKIKPKMVLFLVGENDIGVKYELKYDRQYQAGYYKTNILKSSINSLCNYSDTISLLKYLYKYYLARSNYLYHNPTDFNKLDFIDNTLSEKDSVLAWHRKEFISDYEKRLLMLIKISRNNNIVPIFITQPAFYGTGIDVVTNVNIGNVKTKGNLNGELCWDVLELYNDATRRIGKENNVCVIELAKSLPKRSDYYYDFVHFSIVGADEVGKIVAQQLYSYLNSHPISRN